MGLNRIFLIKFLSYLMFFERDKKKTLGFLSENQATSPYNEKYLRHDIKSNI